MIHAASHFYHEKRVAWVSISTHACDPVPIVMGAPLGGPELRYKPHTIHNSSIRSDEGLTLETSAFESLLRWPIYIVYSVDKTKLKNIYIYIWFSGKKKKKRRSGASYCVVLITTSLRLFLEISQYYDFTKRRFCRYFENCEKALL